MTPGDQPVPRPPCPTLTSDVFQETSYTDNLFDDLMKTTDDFYPDLSPLLSPTPAHDIFSGMVHTDNLLDDLMNQTHDFVFSDLFEDQRSC